MNPFQGLCLPDRDEIHCPQDWLQDQEVPVIFVNRREGTSKMSGGIFGEAFFGVMRLRWDGWFKKYPKKV